MGITTIIKDANPNIVIFLATTLIAFISWIIKSLIEKPILESKNTFNKFFEKRIEILTEFKTRLNLIAYFPEGRDSLIYKEQLQTLLLQDGRAAYLSKQIFDNIIRISIDKKTNEKLLLNTIKLIDDELYLKISKVHDEINFYRKFSNYTPLKRFTGLILLCFQYILSILLIIFILLILATIFFDGNLGIKIILIILIITCLYFIDKWLRS